MPLERLHKRRDKPQDDDPPPPYKLEDSQPIERRLDGGSLPSTAAASRDLSSVNRARTNALIPSSSTGTLTTVAPIAAAIAAPTASRAPTAATSTPAVRTRTIIEILSDSESCTPVKRSKKNKGKRKRAATPEALDPAWVEPIDVDALADQVMPKQGPSAAATRVVKEKKPRKDGKVYFFPGETPPDTPPATHGNKGVNRSPLPALLSFPFPLASAADLALPPRTARAAPREPAPFPTIPPLGIEDAHLVFDRWRSGYKG